MDLSRFLKTPPIRLETIMLGGTQWRIPVAEMRGKSPGKTLLVTAGLDGDEYASIEAAYALIEQYKSGNFTGRLLVLPIVNMPGFEAGTSFNPLDKLYPKYAFPGSADGSATEQLSNWLRQFTDTADAWLDLHAGSLSEHMLPLIWGFDTGSSGADGLARRWHKSSGAKRVVLERAPKGQAAHYMAERGAMYALCESGERGERNPEDIARHVSWAQALMGELGMIEAAPATDEPVILRTVVYVCAPHDGIFRPAPPQSNVAKGDILGTHCRYDGSGQARVVAPANGLVIWSKLGMNMRKGDVLFAIASN